MSEASRLGDEIIEDVSHRGVDEVDRARKRSKASK